MDRIEPDRRFQSGPRSVECVYSGFPVRSGSNSKKSGPDRKLGSFLVFFFFKKMPALYSYFSLSHLVILKETLRELKHLSPHAVTPRQTSRTDATTPLRRPQLPPTTDQVCFSVRESFSPFSIFNFNHLVSSIGASLSVLV